MTDRRKFLGAIGAGALAVPLSTLMKDGVAFAQEDLPMLTTDDPTAVALQYVEVSTVEGAFCKDCVLWTDVTKVDEPGPCALFPGKNVTADGWCISYAKRPE